MKSEDATVDSEHMPLSSRILFSLAAIGLPVGAHLADFNATHIFNPRWPPHAVFHNGQTLAMAILLGALTLWFAWRATAERSTAVFATAAFSGLYWISQAMAILYPRTAFFDPEQNLPANYVLGLPVQVLVEVVFLGLTIAATWLALRPDARWR